MRAGHPAQARSNGMVTMFEDGISEGAAPA